MNPDKNVQISFASLGELTPSTLSVRRLLVVPTWKNKNKHSHCKYSEMKLHHYSNKPLELNLAFAGLDSQKLQIPTSSSD